MIDNDKDNVILNIYDTSEQTKLNENKLRSSEYISGAGAVELALQALA